MYSWVYKYIGIPFVSNGREKNGCDCYGLVRLVLKNEYGIEIPELSNNYSDARNVEETAKLFKEHRPVIAAERIPAPEERAIAVILERGVPAHIGIVAGREHILHTGAKTGSVCQRISHPGIRDRIEGYYHVG